MVHLSQSVRQAQGYTPKVLPCVRDWLKLAWLQQAVISLSLLFPLLAPMGAYGQSPSERDVPPSRATQVPLSGREPQPSSATVTQKTQPGVSSSGSVNAIDTSVTVQGALSGSSPAQQSSAGELRLTPRRRARPRPARKPERAQSVSRRPQARGQRQVARSELLPQLNTEVSEQFERLNHRAAPPAKPPQRQRSVVLRRKLAPSRQLNTLTKQMQLHVDPRHALLRAFSITNATLNSQAQLWAYVDVLRYFALLCAFCVPLAFLLQKPKAGAQGGA